MSDTELREIRVLRRALSMVIEDWLTEKIRAIPNAEMISGFANDAIEQARKEQE